MRLILQFALPLLAGNLLQQTYNIIDAAIVGRCLGTKALASVGASSSVQFLVLGFCIGICSGFGVPVAKSFGAGEYPKMRSYIFHAAVLTGAAACFLAVVCAVFCPQILHLMSTPEDIYIEAYRYLLVIFLGIPFTLLYNLLASILRAVGDSRTPFLFLAFSAGLNIVLDLFCIVVLGWGCAGAAIATVTSQAVSGICCLLFIAKKFELIRPGRQECQLRGDRAAVLLQMGLPMGLQFSITAIGSMVMQSANNSLGSIYVSGFTAGMRIKQFAICPFDAIGNAVSVFSSQNLGAAKIKRIRRGLLEGCGIATLYGAAAGLVLIFFGRTLSLLFVSSADIEVLDASAKYLRCLGYFLWSLGALNVCRMSTQGLGFPGRAIFSGVMEMLARTIVSFVFTGYYGFTAICFSDQSAWLSACLYIVPTCLLCVKKVTRQLQSEKI